MSKLEKPFRTGASAAKAAAAEQKAAIQKQKQLEEAKLAESKDEIARRKALAKTGGRSLLIKSQSAPSPATSTKLGGTV